MNIFEGFNSQMNEYRVRLGMKSDSTSQNDGINASKKPGFMSLAELYGLKDDMMIGSGFQQAKSVEQEYSDYVSAMLSAPSADILKFWEVCRASSFSLIILTHTILGQRHVFPNFVCDGIGLSSDSSIGRTM